MGAFSNYGKVGNYWTTQNQVIDIDPWFTDLSYTGTSDNDVYSGRGGNDTLWGMLGNDVLYGAGGNDTLYGNAGHDWLHGDDGVDTLHGGSGNDFLFGGADTDWLYGGTGRDQLMGDDGHDYLYGEGGNDWLFGGAGADVMNGGTGHDILVGDDDGDIIEGGDGNDHITGGAGADYLVGGAGSDTFSFAGFIYQEGPHAGQYSPDSHAFGHLVGDVMVPWADTIADFDTWLDSIQGPCGGAYFEFATTATSLEEAWRDAAYKVSVDENGNGREVSPGHKVFLYNEETDTGYLMWDGDQDGYHETAIILAGCGSAEDFNEWNFV